MCKIRRRKIPIDKLQLFLFFIYPFIKVYLILMKCLVKRLKEANGISDQ